MALVVFVFAAILMLAGGTAEDPGPDRFLRQRGGDAQRVHQRGGERHRAGQGGHGGNASRRSPRTAGASRWWQRRWSSSSPCRKGDGGSSNVTIRGIGPRSLALRPQVRLSRAACPASASPEDDGGRKHCQAVQGLGGLRSSAAGMRDGGSSGIIDAGKPRFNSEIWADADQVMQAFRRPVYSSVIFKLSTTAGSTPSKALSKVIPRLTLEAKRETRYYLDQSEIMAKFLRILGLIAHGDFLPGGRHRRHDHHVRGGGEPHRRDRHPAGAGFQEATS